MDTAGIFQTADGTESRLWQLTWDKIDTFLPNLRTELFPPGVYIYIFLYFFYLEYSR